MASELKIEFRAYRVGNSVAIHFHTNNFLENVLHLIKIHLFEFKFAICQGSIKDILERR